MYYTVHSQLIGSPARRDHGSHAPSLAWVVLGTTERGLGTVRRGLAGLAAGRFASSSRKGALTLAAQSKIPHCERTKHCLLLYPKVVPFLFKCTIEHCYSSPGSAPKHESKPKTFISLQLNPPLQLTARRRRRNSWRKGTSPSPCAQTLLHPNATTSQHKHTFRQTHRQRSTGLYMYVSHLRPRNQVPKAAAGVARVLTGGSLLPSLVRLVPCLHCERRCGTVDRCVEVGVRARDLPLSPLPAVLMAAGDKCAVLLLARVEHILVHLCHELRATDNHLLVFKKIIENDGVCIKMMMKAVVEIAACSHPSREGIDTLRSFHCRGYASSSVQSQANFSAMRSFYMENHRFSGAIDRE